MKLYNKQLEEIKDIQMENRIQKIGEKNIDFLVKRYRVNEELLRKRLELLSLFERECQKNFVFN